MARPIRIGFKGAFYHVTARGNETIYFIKKWTGINNTKIGDLFGKLSYSAVSKVNTRFSEKLRTDKKLRRGVQKIMEHLSHVKA